MRIIILLLIISVNAIGQGSVDSLDYTAKGRRMVGGSINASTNFEKYYIASFNVSPSFGVFVAKNMAIGARCNIGVTINRTARYLNTGLSPFIRYYLPSTKPLRFFATADVGYYYNYSYENGFYTQYSTHSDGIIIGAAPGLTYFLNKHVGLETMVRYELLSNRAYLNHISAANTRLYLLIGFQIFLGRR